MNSKKFGEYVGHLFPVLLIVSFTLFGMISFFSIKDLQGNARVINYAGIVRGATQQLVKQELNNVENDELSAKLDAILTGLEKGDAKYNLSPLQSPQFQDYVGQMQDSWIAIKKEIIAVRQGEDPQKLFLLSEDYFELANQAVSAAEMYAEEKVQHTTVLLLALNITFVILIILFWLSYKRQKRIYGELQAAEQASREKSQFLSRMSHEIRTPMNGIIGMTEIAKQSIQNPQKVSDCLQKIKLSSDYLLSLINDILDMSRIENGKIELYQEAFDLSSLGDRLYTMFSQKAEDAELAFTVETSGIIQPMVIGDELRISQVIVNMVSNSIKFTPSGGLVRVVFQQKQKENGEYEITIAVSDTGIGMSREFLQRIFQPFEQAGPSASRQYGGTGLGLAISSRLIQLMGGDIKIESQPGKGTRFTVRIELPASQNIEPKQNIPAVVQEDLNGWNILLAEDNDLNAEIAETLLEMKGAHVDRARNGREAADLFCRSDADGYRVILMDIQMPEMDGLEACKIIRISTHPKAKDIPIIGLSANAFQQDMDYALESGMNGYLSKPFEIDQLLETVSRAVTPV